MFNLFFRVNLISREMFPVSGNTCTCTTIEHATEFYSLDST